MYITVINGKIIQSEFFAIGSHIYHSSYDKSYISVEFKSDDFNLRCNLEKTVYIYLCDKTESIVYSAKVNDDKVKQLLYELLYMFNNSIKDSEEYIIRYNLMMNYMQKMFILATDIYNSSTDVFSNINLDSTKSAATR